jgi:DNA relaxase NicK
MSRRLPKVPWANRGPTNLNDTTPAIPDFLRFTVSERAVFGDVFDELRVRQCVVEFIRDLAPQSGIVVEQDCKGGRRGYVHHFQLLTPDGESCGDVSFGGERQRCTVSIELTGGGCARVCATRPFAEAWGHVREMLDSMGARITEFHAAHDDYEGLRDLALARRMYEDGEFDGAFKRPAMSPQGWNDGTGQSIYIGKKTATKQIVIYEKGREQGYRDGDEGVTWVRWEARFYARNRPIPNEVVVAPWEYMVGEYPALTWISAVTSVMTVAVKRVKGNLQSAMRHCQRQYGGLLNFLAGISDDAADLGDLVSSFLTRPTVPAWVAANPFGTVVAHYAHPTRIAI